MFDFYDLEEAITGLNDASERLAKMSFKVHQEYLETCTEEEDLVMVNGEDGPDYVHVNTGYLDDGMPTLKEFHDALEQLQEEIEQQRQKVEALVKKYKDLEEPEDPRDEPDGLY